MADGGDDDEAGMLPRRFRELDSWWLAAMAKADREGTTISALLRKWLRLYVQGTLE